MHCNFRFSLRKFLLFVALVAVGVFIALNVRWWRSDYLDWRATRTVRARAEIIFRDEIGRPPPPELVHIFGSSQLSHWAGVYSIGLTRDQIVSCGYDRAIRCWSTETGELLQVIGNVDGHVAGRSSMMVAIDDDQQARVYDMSSSPLTLEREFSLAGASTVHRAFTSDLNGLLAVIYEHEPNHIQLFDLESGARMAKLHIGQNAEKACIGFREDGRILAARDNALLMFDAQDGESVSHWPNSSFGNAKFVTRLEQPWWLVVGVSNSIVWNENTHQSIAVDRVGGTPNVVIPDSRGQAWLVQSGVVTSIKMVGDRTRQAVHPTSHVSRVSCMALFRYSGGGQIFTLRAIGDDSGQVRLLDEYGSLQLPRSERDHITAVAWSPLGDHLAAATSTGELIVMQASTWIEAQRFRGHSGRINHLEFSPDGHAILTEERQEIAVFDWNSARSLVRKARQASVSRDATLTSGGGRLLAWVLNEGWTLTDYTTNTPIAASDVKAPSSLPFSPQGAVWSEHEKCFVFVSRDGLCRIKLDRQGASGEPTLIVTPQSHPDKEVLLDISVQHSLAAFADRSGMRIWNWQAPSTHRISLTAGASPISATFSPSADEFAAVIEGDVVVYSITGRELSRLRIGSAQSRIMSVEYSPDGRYLAVVNGNGTCYLLRNPSRS